MHGVAGRLETAEKSNYRPDIDGLRALAVVSVVSFHAFPSVVQGGFVGVDIFFVISGFLISSVLFSEMTESRFSFARFFERRVRRIFPALVVCLAVVLAYGFVALMPFELAQLGKHVFFGASFLSNIALWSEIGYFDTAASLKPLLHLWSLGVEEQFYIVWPALLWVAFRVKAPIGKLLFALSAASFAANIALSKTSISADFYSPVSRFWEILAGAGLAWRRGIQLTPNARTWLAWIGFAAILISAALFTPKMSFPGWLALIPVSGAMAVLAAGPEAAINRKMFSNRAAVFVGLISYPLYLWHWPLISYALIIRMEKPLTPLMAIALVAASFLLAWATYRFIEYPLRFGVLRHRGAAFLASCMVAIGALGLMMWIKNGFPERFPPYPDGLDIQKISAAKLDPIYMPTAGMEVTDQDTILISHLGHGTRKVALAGDSLLQHYGPRVQELADRGRLAANVYFVTLPSCVPISGFDNSSRCPLLPGILMDLVRREHVQSVVIGAFWPAYNAANRWIERNGKRLSLDTTEGRNDLYANLEDDVRKLQAEGAKVYLVLGLPGPHPRFNPSEMVTRNLTGFRIAPDFDGGISIKQLREIQATTDNHLRSIAERTGAILLDPFPDVCGIGESCAPIYGVGEPKFSDGLHLRPTFVRRHIHFLDSLLK